MIFSFIKYTQPGWYFNLIPKGKEKFSCCYFHPELLPLPESLKIETDDDFENESSRNADIAYRAWYSGMLLQADVSVIDKINEMLKPTLNDEYRFIIKYWGKGWGIFILLIRLVTFKNPFKEISGFNNSRNVSKFNLYQTVIERNDYNNFHSTLIQQQPFVSIIIPTLNRYEYLKDVLLDLQNQNYKNFEVIIVDQSEDFDSLFYKQYKLNLNIIKQKEKLLWTARNNAIKESKADYFLFFDDDSRVDADWIEQHLKCMDYFDADISAGISISLVGGKVPASYDFFRWADQFDSGNALVKRKVFEAIGLFDLQFNKQSMGDSEFGLRSYLNGFICISNPKAKRVHLKVSSGGLREIGHWDGFRPKKLFAPKPVPSVVYLFKKYFPKELYRNNIYLGILISNLSFKKKKDKSSVLLSGLLTIIKFPLLIIQFQKSLFRANKMLAEGDKIEWLN